VLTQPIQDAGFSVRRRVSLRSNMQQCINALAKLTLEKDGVDGQQNHLYGEGLTLARWPTTTPVSQRQPEESLWQRHWPFNRSDSDGIRGGWQSIT